MDAELKKAQENIEDNSIKRLALIMTVNCVRNTIIEDFHGRGSLSQADMKVFNKEVSNKLYTFLKYLLTGTDEEKSNLVANAGMYYPHDWDQPIIDKDIKGAAKTRLTH